MPRLTRRLVADLEPQDKEYFVWDDRIPGFGVRVRGARKTYVLQYRHLKRTRRRTIGPTSLFTLQEAREAARTRLVSVRAGIDPLSEVRVPMTSLVQRWLDDHVELHLKANTRRQYRTYARQILAHLGHLDAAGVTRADVSHMHTAMRQTPYQANRVLAAVRKLFDLAEAWGLRDEGSNPAGRIPRYPEKSRERYLSMEELQRLGDVLRDAERERVVKAEVLTLIRLLIFTGARLNEIATLRWDAVDIERGVIRLSDSKTGPANIYLPKSAVEILLNQKRRPGNPYVLPGRYPGRHISPPHHTWRQLCARAQIDGARLHDLRHTFASIGVRRGYSLPVIGALLGHRRPGTTARYSHLGEDPVLEAVEDIAEHLRQALK